MRQTTEENTSTAIPTRQSARLKEKPKIDYKKMNSGEQTKITNFLIQHLSYKNIVVGNPT